MNKLVVVMGLNTEKRCEIAREFAEQIGAIVISKNTIAQEFGELRPGRAATILSQKISSCLRRNLNVVLEDDCLEAKRRMGLLKHLTQSRIECEKICVFVGASFEGKELLLMNFRAPWYNEGWDTIQIIPNTDDDTSYEWSSELFQRAQSFEQHNSHHNMTLGEHCDVTCEAAKEAGVTTTERCAARWHDIGKLWTQTIDAETGEAHYYGHAGLSAYAWLHGYTAVSRFNGANENEKKEALRAAAVIGLHMEPYQDGWQERLRKRNFDETIIAAVDRIHQFDQSGKEKQGEII